MRSTALSLPLSVSVPCHDQRKNIDVEEWGDCFKYLESGRALRETPIQSIKAHLHVNFRIKPAGLLNKQQFFVL